jgi:hypothetical protein
MSNVLYIYIYIYAGWPKSRFSEKNEYVEYGPSKQADFFINNRDMSKVYIHKKSLS